MQAHFRLGEIAWKASCARASDDGACLHVERMTATRSRQVIEAANRKLGTARSGRSAGPPTKSKIVLFDRNRPQTAGRRGALPRGDQAVEGGRRARTRSPGATPTRASGRRRTRRRARRSTWPRSDYEDLLRIKFPQSLDFSQPSPRDNPRRRGGRAKKLADSQQAVRGLPRREDHAAGQDARSRYLDVFKLRQAQWTIAAAARVGQLHQDFAGQLYTAEIPKDLPDTDAVGQPPARSLLRARWRTRRRRSRPRRSRASRLPDRRHQQSWYNNWSRLCERELNQLQPAEFPLSSEVKPEAGYVSTMMTPSPVVNELSESVTAGSAPAQSGDK